MREKVKLLAEAAGFSSTYEIDRLEKFYELIVNGCIVAVENTDRRHAYTTYDYGLIGGTIERSIEQICKDMDVPRKYKVANILLDN